MSGTTLSSLGAPTAVITKSADETITNSTTLQDDDHLTWNGFTSGKNYFIELNLLLSRTNTTVHPSSKIAFTGNSDGYMVQTSTDTPTLADGVNSIGMQVVVNGGIPKPAKIMISIKATSNFTGTLKWAQGSLSAVTGVTVHKGSRMMIWEVA